MYLKRETPLRIDSQNLICSRLQLESLHGITENAGYYFEGRRLMKYHKRYKRQPDRVRRMNEIPACTVAEIRHIQFNTKD